VRGGRSDLLAGLLRGLLECDEERRISAAVLHVRLAAAQVCSARRANVPCCTGGSPRAGARCQTRLAAGWAL